ncbi:MAG: MmcQ/YjbR family DNA-binding protein [Acidobacteriia bacterium]|nr:MmcQ/YjbR family DNA-binding protein [Terriglobia bacterium]
MDVEALRRYCLSFSQAAEDMPWPDDLCFKVNGKIFAAVSLSTLPRGLTFKCTPETFAELVEREGINPAPYVGRYKRVRLGGLDVLQDAELKELVRQSYEMVVAKAKVAGRGADRQRKKSKKRGK